jgi:mono/diheme cytochrome c family protein
MTMTTMNERRKTVAAMTAVLSLTLALASTLPSAAPGGQAPAIGSAGAPRAGGPGGGGPGAANPAAALYAEHCAGCHGTDLAGGRAPSLFNEQWLATMPDARLTASIRGGDASAGMPPSARC